MSKKIKVVFVHGVGGISPIIAAVEKFGERLHGSNKIDFVPTHVGIIVDGLFQEALSDGFIGNNINHYKPENLRIYEIEIKNTKYIHNGNIKFNSLLGEKYSYHALLCGLVYTIFRVVLPNYHHEVDCSEAVTDILRAYGIDLFKYSEASSVTPNELMTEVAKVGTLCSI